MAISKWRTPDEQARHDSSRPKKSRSRFYEHEATEHQRRLIDLKRELREENARIKAEQVRATLWEDFDSEALLQEALEAQELARDLQAAKELRQEIEVQVLITEIDQEVEQPQKRGTKVILVLFFHLLEGLLLTVETRGAQQFPLVAPVRRHRALDAHGAPFTAK